MPTVKSGTSSPDVNVKNNEYVTWEVDLEKIGPKQYLRVEVTSPYETIRGTGSEGKNKFDLKMSFEGGGDVDIPLFYSLYLVTLPVTPGGTPTETPLDPGPKLVIDDIGKPPGFCPDEDEEKKFAAPYSVTHR